MHQHQAPGLATLSSSSTASEILPGRAWPFASLSFGLFKFYLPREGIHNSWKDTNFQVENVRAEKKLGSSGEFWHFLCCVEERIITKKNGKRIVGWKRNETTHSLALTVMWFLFIGSFYVEIDSFGLIWSSRKDSLKGERFPIFIVSVCHEWWLMCAKEVIVGCLSCYIVVKIYSVYEKN